MSKYMPLINYLTAQKGDHVGLDFDEIEAILGFPLPASARKHRAWWCNQVHGSHSWSVEWLDAGWRTDVVKVKEERVEFRRESGL